MKTFKVLVLLLGFTACVSQREIDDLKQGQEKILAKLDQLAKAGPQRAAARDARAGEPDPQKTYAVPVGSSAAKGPEDAWVTIVAISDFQCPFCKRVVPTLEQIEKTYEKEVRVVFKHNALPFHKQARPAALAAECAGEQGKFWPMHDALFADQKALDDGGLEAAAKKAGVDVGRWKGCYTGGKPGARIDADQQLANSLGARGTPAFFINGRYLSGAQPFEAFKALIDEELAKAKQSGIPRRDYYQKAVLEKGARS